tara:strand:- start:74 stop:1057 length:984 start_codon:yes stop_codon:yes gene_type:complete
MNSSLKQFIFKQNLNKKLFTPGPASLLEENIKAIQPCFGRGDAHYDKIENYVLEKIKEISGHKNIIRMQGSASLALETMIVNFLFGKVLLINTGVYSDRLLHMCKTSKKIYKNIKSISTVNYKDISDINGNFDWIIGCPVETSIGLKIPIDEFFKLKKRCKSKLALDATGSIGLENGHEYSDIAGFSSCKGLFGLTGSSFVVFNNFPTNHIEQFNLNLMTHFEKKMTGPYHSICSLYEVLKSYKDFKFAVTINKKIFLKKMNNYLIYKNLNQPNLCTFINKKILKKSSKVILYQSRAKIAGSVVCHLGEVHLKKNAKGKIVDSIKLV